jgi:hypothetical protein
MMIRAYLEIGWYQDRLVAGNNLSIHVADAVTLDGGLRSGKKK